MSTNFRLELIEPFAMFWTVVEREEWGGASEEGEENIYKPSETQNSGRAKKNC